MESTPSAVCASCGQALSASEEAFGARLCPSCSSQRAEASRKRLPEADAPEVGLLEQQILDLVQRELAVDTSPAGASRLYNAAGAPAESEGQTAGLVLMDGRGILVPLPKVSADDERNSPSGVEVEPDTNSID